MRGKPLVAVLLQVLCASCLNQVASAQGYPNKPISLVVPYGAGGGTDIIARIYAKGLSEEIGQPVLVVNKAGASGIVGAQSVTMAKPDGYTMLFTVGNLQLNQHYLFKQTPYHVINDFKPVVQLGTIEAVLVVNRRFPANTLSEFIELARKSPGKYTYAFYGDLAVPSIASDAGIEIEKIPYKSGIEAMTDVARGEVDIILNSVIQAMPLVESGDLKILAAQNDKRIRSLPNVPTVKETMPDFSALSYQTVFVSKDTPDDIVNLLYQKSLKVLSTPAIAQEIEKRGIVVDVKSPAETKEFLQKDFERLARVTKQAKIAPE
jgi:tripartite-type tricarboxylate transporter receptor subunit TctC